MTLRTRQSDRLIAGVYAAFILVIIGLGLFAIFQSDDRHPIGGFRAGMEVEKKAVHSLCAHVETTEGRSAIKSDKSLEWACRDYLAGIK